jgi:hypothetical protein
MRIFKFYIHPQILLGRSNQRERGGTHGRGEESVQAFGGKATEK